MKKGLCKRLLCISLIAALCSLSTVSAAASSGEQSGTIDNILITTENNMQRAENPEVRDTITPNGTVYLYPQLSSYIGLTQRIYITTTSYTGSTTGAVFLYLTSPNGNLVSNDWIMGTSEATYWDVFLPASGTWTLKAIALGTDANVHIFARWGEPDKEKE